MEYCMWDYCLSGYELAFFAVIELAFWIWVGIFSYKKLKSRNKKIHKN